MITALTVTSFVTTPEKAYANQSVRKNPAEYKLFEIYEFI